MDGYRLNYIKYNKQRCRMDKSIVDGNLILNSIFFQTQFTDGQVMMITLLLVRNFKNKDPGNSWIGFSSEIMLIQFQFFTDSLRGWVSRILRQYWGNFWRQEKLVPQNSGTVNHLVFGLFHNSLTDGPFGEPAVFWNRYRWNSTSASDNKTLLLVNQLSLKSNLSNPF